MSFTDTLLYPMFWNAIKMLKLLVGKYSLITSLPMTVERTAMDPFIWSANTRFKLQADYGRKRILLGKYKCERPRVSMYAR